MNKKKFIPVANPTVDIEEAKAVFNQVRSGWISMGKKVQEFENKVQKFIGVKNAIAMNNGTSALDALLTALNINEKDEGGRTERAGQKRERRGSGDGENAPKIPASSVGVYGGSGDEIDPETEELRGKLFIGGLSWQTTLGE